MENITPSLTLVDQTTIGSHIHVMSDPIYKKVYAWLPVLFVFYIVYIRYFTGIFHIPGPFLASVSNIWKINAAWHKEMPQRNIALHQKYGPLVRIGPNMISVDDPAALNIIYGFRPIYLKVDTIRSSYVTSQLTHRRPHFTQSWRPCIMVRCLPISSPHGLSNTMIISNVHLPLPTQ